MRPAQIPGRKYVLVVFEKPFASTDNIPHLTHVERTFGSREGRVQAFLLRVTDQDVKNLQEKFGRKKTRTHVAEVITPSNTALYRYHWKHNTWLHEPLREVFSLR